VNIFDTFPRRNLPAEAEPWGRFAEEKVYALENAITTNGQSADGLNRNTASTLQDLGKQLEKLDAQVQRLNDLYGQLPKAFQATQNRTNFAVGASGWQNIASVSFTAPDTGKFTIGADAVGRLQTASTTTNVEVTYRLIAKTTASPTIAGIFWSPEGEFQNTFSLSWGWEIPVIQGESVAVAIQANPTNPATWPAHPATYATIQSNATFVVN